MHSLHAQDAQGTDQAQSHGWHELWSSAHSMSYWHNHVTGESRWEPPPMTPGGEDQAQPEPQRQRGSRTKKKKQKAIGGGAGENATRFDAPAD